MVHVDAVTRTCHWNAFFSFSWTLGHIQTVAFLLFFASDMSHVCQFANVRGMLQLPSGCLWPLLQVWHLSSNWHQTFTTLVFLVVLWP